MSRSRNMIELQVLDTDENAIQPFHEGQELTANYIQKTIQESLPPPIARSLQESPVDEEDQHSASSSSQSCVGESATEIQCDKLRQRTPQNEIFSAEIKSDSAGENLQIQSRRQSMDIPTDFIQCLKISSKIYLQAFILELDVLFISMVIPLAVLSFVVNFTRDLVFFITIFPLWTLFVQSVAWDDIYRGLYVRKRYQKFAILHVLSFSTMAIIQYALVGRYAFHLEFLFYVVIVALILFFLSFFLPEIMIRPVKFDESVDKRFKNPLYRKLKLKAFYGLRRLMTVFNFFVHIEITVVVLIFIFCSKTDSYAAKMVVMPMFHILLQLICIHFRMTRTFKEESRSYRLFSIFTTFSSVIQRIFMSHLVLSVVDIVVAVVLTSVAQIFLRISYIWTINIYFYVSASGTDASGISDRERNQSIGLAQEASNKIAQLLDLILKMIAFRSVEKNNEIATWIWMYQQSEVRSLFAGPMVSFLHFWLIQDCELYDDTNVKPLVLLILQIIIQFIFQVFCDISYMILEMKYLKIPLNRPEVRPAYSPEARGWMVFYGQLYGFISLILIHVATQSDACPFLTFY